MALKKSREIRLKLTTKLLNRAGILRKYHTTELTDYYGSHNNFKDVKNTGVTKSDWIDAKDNYETIQFYRRNFDNAYKKGKGLFLWGNSGTGKTLLTLSLAKEIIKLGYKVRVVSANGLVQSFADSWKDENLNFEKLVMSVDFLVIEEINKEFFTSLTTPTMTRVIKYREAMNLPTCYTSNESLASIKTNYSNAISSAIKGSCLEMHFDSNFDWREVEQKHWHSDVGGNL